MSTHQSDDPNDRGLSRRLFVLTSCAAVSACGKAPMESTDMGMGPCDLGEKSMGTFRVPDADQLKVGQTMLVPGEETIISRDARGFMAMWNKCRHAGCALNFNAQERTYDCPCHGSRYDLYGLVKQGPATDPLLHRIMCRENGVLTVSRSLITFRPNSERTT